MIQFTHKVFNVDARRRSRHRIYVLRSNCDQQHREENGKPGKHRDDEFGENIDSWKWIMTITSLPPVFIYLLRQRYTELAFHDHTQIYDLSWGLTAP